MSDFVVGVTGSIGAGKSTVAGLLARRGAFVIDADALGHEALVDLRDEIASRFGEGILQGGAVNRAKLAALVFADAGKRRELEALVHPHLRRRATELIGRAAGTVVLDAALLMEAQWDEACDVVVFVDAPRPLRLERVRARSGWDEATLDAREAAQLPLTRKRERADHVIENDSSLECLSRQVDELLQRWDHVPR